MEIVITTLSCLWEVEWRFRGDRSVSLALEMSFNLLRRMLKVVVVLGCLRTEDNSMEEKKAFSVA